MKNKKIMKVGIILDDIEKAAEAWSNFLDLDEDARFLQAIMQQSFNHF